MTLEQVLQQLNDTHSDLTFYECGSRAVAQRIGSDDVTQEQIDAAYKKWVCDPLGGGLKDDRKNPYYWKDNKPILITDSTDYDFFCQHDSKHVAYLQALGFVSTYYSVEDKATDDYRDDLCAAVFQHQVYKIQVVTRSDALLYKAIFDNIPHEIYHDFLWKSSPTKPNRDNIKRWFNTLATVAKAVQELN